jgi:hypothetical protein
MPLLKVEADKLSNNDLVRGIVEEIIDADDVFQLLPFVRTEGKAYVYNRENTLAASQFIVPNVDVPEDASTFTEITVTLRIMAGDVDVDNFIQETEGDHNDQKAIQVALKAKSTARLFSNKFINGDETTTYNLTALGGGAAVANVEFDGLDQLATVAQSFNKGANGASLSFEHLDELLDKVKLGADAFIFSRRSIRTYQKLLRALGGVQPEFVELDNGKRIMAYSGVPILLNDFISDAQTLGSSTDTSVIYALRMNELDGLHGVYGGDEVGIRFQEIGQLQHRDATRSRIKWYVCLALKGTLSLARLTGVRE